MSTTSWSGNISNVEPRPPGAHFPPIEPFDAGFLEEAGGHRVWFEQCGAPDGLPLVFLHGGPGSGCGPAHRRFFDPAVWRAVLFDQRGAGRSEPAGRVEQNRTADLLEDMERLRRRLGIERWTLFGGSWGATLALAYARLHPQRVAAMVLRGPFLASAAEIDWFLMGLRRFVPEAWARMAQGMPAGSATELLAAYHERVHGADPAAGVAAARAWAAWESAVMALTERREPGPPPPDAAVLARVRVQTHYLANGCFLPEGISVAEPPQLPGRPLVIVQGRLDMVCPPANALALAAVLPGVVLRMVDGAGHSAFEPAIAAALAEETARVGMLLREAG